MHCTHRVAQPSPWALSGRHLFRREAGQLLEHARGLGLGPTDVEQAVVLAAGDWEEVRASAPPLHPVVAPAEQACTSLSMQASMLMTSTTRAHRMPTFFLALRTQPCRRGSS